MCKQAGWHKKVKVSTNFQELKDLFLSKIPEEEESLKGFLTSRGSGFFLIPATANQYNAHTHGLLVHSLLSYYFAIEDINNIANSIVSPITIEQKEHLLSKVWLMLVADIYKWDSYRQEWGPQKIEGNWVDIEKWVYHDDGFAFGQSEKSVFILGQCGVKLMQEQALALRWCRSYMAEENERNSVIKATLRFPLVEVFASAKTRAANWHGTTEDLAALVCKFEEALCPKEFGAVDEISTDNIAESTSPTQDAADNTQDAMQESQQICQPAIIDTYHQSTNSDTQELEITQPSTQTSQRIHTDFIEDGTMQSYETPPPESTMVEFREDPVYALPMLSLDEIIGL